MRDTPSLKLIEQGFGGADTDRQAVADCMQLLRVSKRLLGFFYDHFSRHGISPGKYSVLCELLADGGPMSPSMLADRIGVSRPTITGLLDGLCAQGLVSRIPDPGDRRRMNVQLTPAGRRFLEQLMPTQFALMGEVVSSLTGAERKQLRRILTRLEEPLS